MQRETAGTSGKAAAASGSVDRKPGLKARAIDEGKKALVITAYLWVLFVVLDLHKEAVLAQNHIDLVGQGFAIVNALVLAKVILIADGFKLGRRFEDRPLLYSVLYASLLFSALLIAFHIVESGLTATFRGRAFRDGLADLGAGNLQGVLSYAAIAFVALIPFFLFRGIARVIGEDRLWALVLTELRGEDAAAPE